jgi:hypothetical protein
VFQARKAFAWGVAAASLAAAAVSCAVGVRRDLAKIPPSQVIFDDKCDLQDYFDNLAPPQNCQQIRISTCGRSKRSTAA